MYSKFFTSSGVDTLQQDIDDFLKQLDEVTGQISNMKITQYNDNLVVLIIYNCWKKL